MNWGALNWTAVAIGALAVVVWGSGRSATRVDDEAWYFTAWFARGGSVGPFKTSAICKEIRDAAPVPPEKRDRELSPCWRGR